MADARARDRTRVVAVGRTDTGRQRRHNEDHVLLRPELDLFVVADGMGGHNAGDVASKLTTTSLGNFFDATAQRAPAGKRSAEDAALDPDAWRLVAGIRKANRDVFEISNTMHQHQGMGSTVVAAVVSRATGKIHIGHVGDSRCYRIRKGRIELLTRDHSLVNDALAIKPDLSEEELARLPRNIITRALGMKELVKVDLRSEDVEPGDVFLLCSDGLSGMVSDEQILEAFAITDDLNEVSDLLVAMANDAGGNDNITALVLRVEEVRASSAPELDTGHAGVTVPPLDGIVSDETMDLLQAGIEVDLAGVPRPRRASVPVARCPTCKAELLVGNRFCVECGSEISA